MGKAFSKYYIRMFNINFLVVSINETKMSLPPKPLSQSTTQKLWDKDQGQAYVECT